ncbi:aldehyde dehydrogenase family protein [Marinibactrum halimedae]|uniref:Aldehyde dehydrogenase n=1 Tax=Marinibactrum halimedae TaxID=1444977 RepID=A0AA37T4M9_9GAMM|nr:aldehyde dehydrogenase family protein [Marinibactrum halimedae]MCD9458160.1 aldehyde dehydrogenase family protein [Marinibactrum halimedae]GLS25093.1 aldehyde dehydrogenase [Marinibactrum halimedae]
MTTQQQQAYEWAKSKKANYINGQWQPPERLYLCHNPATNTPIGEVPSTNQHELDEAVSAARNSFHNGWGNYSRRERAKALIQAGQIIREHQEELAALITLENGKLYRESLEDDMPDTADLFDYFAGWTDKFYGETAPVEPGFVNYIQREAVGVCGLIIPWNFPLLLAMWKIAPALCLGNTVVVKPSEETPYSLLRTLELWDAAGVFPPGTINVVCGAGDVGSLITHHPDIDKVSFTGSTATGKKIVLGSGESNLKTVTLELGGKAPVLLFEDTPDLDAAIERCFHVAYSQKGEKCTEPTRLLIHDSIYETVSQKMTERVNGIVCGDPYDADAYQGAQSCQAQFEKIMGYIESGKKAGATLLAGGEALTLPGEYKNGFYVQPTLFGNVDNQLAIAREEIFGPVLILQSFSDEEQAITLTNDTIYGLAAGLYTADVSRAHRVASAIDAGQVFVNRYGCYDFASPFGGFKQSGWGKEMGIHVLSAYSRVKSVWIAYD